MNVTHTDRIKKTDEAYDRLQEATDLLEEAIGPSAGSANGEWDQIKNDKGHPLYTLRISDWTDTATASFTPDELQAKTHMRVRLCRLWGNLLQTRNHRELQQLLRSRGGESK
jgi:hypothetical protein